MFGDFGNGFAGAFPTEILIPIAAVLRSEFDLAVMPQGFGIDGGAVKITEYGFQQHVFLLAEEWKYATSTPNQLDSIMRIRYAPHHGRNQRYPQRITDLESVRALGS